MDTCPSKISAFGVYDDIAPPPPKELGEINQSYKICTKCGILKLFVDFPKNKKTKDGLSSWCKKCHRNAGVDFLYRKVNGIKLKNSPPGFKYCPRCKTNLPLNEFHREKGLCKKCAFEYQKEYKKTHVFKKKQTQCLYCHKEIYRYIPKNKTISKYAFCGTLCFSKYKNKIPESIPNGFSWCGGCKQILPNTNFHFSKRINRCLYKCKDCARKDVRYSYWRKMGVPEVWLYYCELKTVLGKCYICGKSASECIANFENGQPRISVDHDHKTTTPRGFLCPECNHVLQDGHSDTSQELCRFIWYLCRGNREDFVAEVKSFLEDKEWQVAFKARQDYDPTKEN